MKKSKKGSGQGVFVAGIVLIVLGVLAVIPTEGTSASAVGGGLLFIAVGAFLIWLSKKLKPHTSGKPAATTQPVKVPATPTKRNVPNTLPSHYIVFDLETTGLSRTESRIIEIAANEYKNGVLVGQYHTYVDPGQHIPAAITRMTGITDADVKGAPKIAEVKEKLLSFFGNTALVGHNISTFDIPFLECQLGVSLRNREYDTVRLARRAFPGLPSYKLQYLDQALGLGCLDHHRAGNDIIITQALFDACKHPEKYRHLLTAKRLAGIEVPKSSHLSFESVDIHSIVPTDPANIRQTALTGKTIVFTGALTIPREDAMQMAVDAGAILKSSVSAKTDYLVVGEQDCKVVGATGTSTKQRKAMELIANGNRQLQIIGEEKFLRLLDSRQ